MTPSLSLANKAAKHHSEVSYGADVGKQRKKLARRAYSRADRRAAREFCRENAIACSASTSRQAN